MNVEMNDITFSLLQGLPIPTALARDIMSQLTLGRIQFGLKYAGHQNGELRRFGLTLSSEVDPDYVARLMAKMAGLCDKYGVKHEIVDNENVRGLFAIFY